MMRYRSALMAGLLALAVAVCDDDGTVVQPPPTVNVSPPQVTVTVPPAPPVVAPLQAMITPPSAEVGVDGMVDFAIGTSGGSGDASWTCTSSDTAVATVETTDTGCRATAVAGGGATITAAVTKGSESTNVAANLTVSTTADAFILVTNVSGEDNSDESGLKGTVDVTISVERGNQTFERLSLNVDGMEVASQDFGTAAAAEDAEQTTHPFTLSFDSDGYEEHGDHVDVDYMNGEHSIQALLKIAGRDEALMSNVMLVEFDNDDKLMASLSGLGEGAVNSSTGQMWYGGPDASVEISALPVVYSSGDVSSVTLQRFCGDDAMTDSEAPFMFEVDCGGYMTTLAGGDKPMFNVGGDDIDVSASAVYLDFMAPMAPHFQVNPNDREGGWVNASVGFTAEYDADDMEDGWLVYNDDDAGDGVGGYMPQLRIAEAGDDEEVGGALAAPALMEVPAMALAALAGQSSDADAYCVVASATDMLGNESKLPDDDDSCVSAEDYDATDADNSAGLLAGIDLQAPTIAFSPASPKADDMKMRNFQVQLSDEGSGIRAEDPLDASVNLRNADDDEEIDDLMVEVSLPLATTEELPGEMGYYTFTATVTDKAGNVSEEVTRTALHDTEMPGASTIVGDYDDDEGQFSLVATVTDNLSINAYWAEARFGTGDLSLRALGDDGAIGTPISITQGLFLPREGGTGVDAYNAASLTQAALAPDLTVMSYRALQADNQADGAIGNLTTLNSLVVVSSDHGGQKSATAAPAAGAGLVPTDFAGFDLSADPIGSAGSVTADDVEGVDDSDRKTFTSFTAKVDQSGGEVEVTVEASGRFFVMPVVGVTAVEADPNADPPVEAVEGVDEVVGNEGLRDNPLTRIDFYATTTTFDIDLIADEADADLETTLKYIGSVDGATAGAQDFDDAAITTDPVDANDSRKYIYTMTISESALAGMVGEDGEYTGHIVAFGVKDDEGAALAAPAVPVVIDD